jgi:hypothetical protein
MITQKIIFLVQRNANRAWNGFTHKGGPIQEHLGYNIVALPQLMGTAPLSMEISEKRTPELHSILCINYAISCSVNNDADHTNEEVPHSR